MSDSSAYDAAEIGDSSAQDVRLYVFTRGTAAWLCNSGDSDVVYAGQTYPAFAIMDAGIKQKGEATSDDFIITVASYHPVAQMFNGTPPSGIIGVLVRQMQFGVDGEAPIIWKGMVSSVKIKDDISSDILCNTQTAYLNRQGLRLTYDKMCPHSLYDSQCRVDKTLWVENATVLEVNGEGFTYALDKPSAADPGRFVNGYVEWDETADYKDMRPILNAVENRFQLIGMSDGIVSGQRIAIYPGCRRTPTNCLAFNNVPNYGGFPFMPGVSPFDGNPVF